MKFPFQGNTLGAVLANIGIVLGILLFLGMAYFYVYLPNITNHMEMTEVPDLTGKSIQEMESILEPLSLRYELGDSSYSADLPPLTVLQQFPKPGHLVKENRKIYVSINRSSPPSLPVPNLLETSLTNGEAVLKNNELKRGRVLYQQSPFRDLILELRMNGEVILPGTRVPKGAVIDLVVGNGAGPKDFLIANLVGLPYENARLRLGNLNLLMRIQIPDDVDTTGSVTYVYKQFPEAGDSVKVGDAVDLWIGPKGYKPEEKENEDPKD